MRKGSKMAKTLTPKEIALDWGISPKTLRKFLRTEAKAKSVETPGKGGRWAIPAGSLKSMRKRFDAWNAAKDASKEDATETPEPDVEVETLEPDADAEVTE